MRLVLAAAGWVCVALGALGVILPLLPTTPFLLLAASAFMKTSPRAHRWLLRNRLFGPLIQNWQEHRCVPPRAKALAIGVLVIVFATSGTFAVDSLAPRVLLGVVGLSILTYLWRLPTAPRMPAGSEDGDSPSEVIRPSTVADATVEETPSALG